MLGRHVGVAQRLGFLVGAVERPGEFARQRGLGRGPGLFGEAVELPLGLGLELGDVEPRFLEQRDDDAVVLRQQGGEEMSVVDDGVAPRAGQHARLLQGFRGFHGQTFGSDHSGGTVGNLRAG